MNSSLTQISLKYLVFTVLIFVIPAERFSKNPASERKTQEYVGLKKSDFNWQLILPLDRILLKQVYDKSGNLLIEEYLNKNQKPVNNPLEKNVAKKSFLYNEKDELLSEEYTDESGKLKNFSFGTARKEYARDESGNLQEEISFDENSQIIQKTRYTYHPKCLELTKNADSCIALVETKDKNGALANNPIRGTAKEIYDYDSRANKTLSQSYNANGKISSTIITSYDLDCLDKTKNTQICFTHEEYIEFDEKSNLKKYGKTIRNFDSNCLATHKNAENCIIQEEHRDSKNKLTNSSHSFQVGCFKPVTTRKYFYARKKAAFDSNGNRILEEFYDKDGMPIEDSFGVFRYKYEFDEVCIKKNGTASLCHSYSEIYNKSTALISKTKYNVECLREGRSLINPPINYCIEEKDFNIPEQNFKHITRIENSFDSSGKKTSRKVYTGEKIIFSTEFSYDGDTLLKEINKTEDGKLTEDENGIAVYEAIKEGNKITEFTLDKNGKLKDNSFKYAKRIAEYDEACLAQKKDKELCVAEELFINSKEIPVEITDTREPQHSYAKKIQKFDSKGQRSSVSYFGGDLKPLKGKNSVSTYHFFYDPAGQEIQVDYILPDNSLYYSLKKEYDPDCKKISADFRCEKRIEAVDKLNKPVDRLREGNFFFQKEEFEYDARCMEVLGNPYDCLLKKEISDSRSKILDAEYFKIFLEENTESKVKLVKLKSNKFNVPISIEFIKE